MNIWCHRLFFYVEIKENGTVVTKQKPDHQEYILFWKSYIDLPNKFYQIPKTKHEINTLQKSGWCYSATNINGCSIPLPACLHRTAVAGTTGLLPVFNESKFYHWISHLHLYWMYVLQLKFTFRILANTNLQPVIWWPLFGLMWWLRKPVVCSEVAQCGWWDRKTQELTQMLDGEGALKT